MRAAVIVGGLLMLVLIVGAVFGITYTSKYNGLVQRHEGVNEGRSRFAAAINTCTQKMKAVWAMADQEGILEKETYLGVAKARAGYDEARKNAEAVDQQNAPEADLMRAGADLGRAMINVRIAFEAYPQLKTSEVYQRAMVGVEEGYNEIKTSLDDWIRLCRQYNTYRRSFMTDFLAKSFFGDKFPAKIAYYEGGITDPEQMKIPMDDLNPRSQQ